MNLPPIRLYEFGTVERWRKAIIRAIEEDIVIGKTIKTIIEKEGRRTKAQALGTSLVNWYEVEIYKTGESTYVGCRCRAGENATPCKHVARVFLEKGWIPWPTGITVQPRIIIEDIEEDLVLSVVKNQAERGE